MISMAGMHIYEPITTGVLARNSCDVVRPTDSFSSEYVQECHHWLLVSYASGLTGIIQFFWLLAKRRVECVFQFFLWGVLAFLQTADYLQCVWMYQSYQILIYGI